MTTEMRSGRVISVDDNATNQKVVTSILSKAGHLVQQIMDGPSALEMIRDQQPDLVLLDIMMPDMNGYEVIRALKDDKRTAEIPVIFVTAKSQARDLQAGFEAGAVDYVTKPFAFEELIARVNCQLDLLRQRQKMEAMQQELEKLNGELFDYNIQTTEASSRQDREIGLLRQKVQRYETALSEALDSRSNVARQILPHLSAALDEARELKDFPRILRRLLHEGTSEEVQALADNSENLGTDLVAHLEKLMTTVENSAAKPDLPKADPTGTRRTFQPAMNGSGARR